MFIFEGVCHLLIIGICGGSGSGKTTVARILANSGAPCFDADAVYRTLTDTRTPCVDELADAFGEEIVTPEGALDRAKMASLVFSDSAKAQENRTLLNEITHRHVKREFFLWRESLKSKGCPLAVLDVPLLYESGMDQFCDAVIAVVAERPVRVARIVVRDGITRREAEARMDAQLSDVELCKRTPYVLDNSADTATLKTRLTAILQEIYLRKDIQP